MSQKCIVCGRGLADGIALYRHNAIGEVPAQWACINHVKTPVDPVVQDITETFAGPAEKRDRRMVVITHLLAGAKEAFESGDLEQHKIFCSAIGELGKRWVMAAN